MWGKIAILFGAVLVGISSASPAPQNLTTIQDIEVLDDGGVEHTRKGKCASYL